MSKLITTDQKKDLLQLNKEKEFQMERNIIRIKIMSRFNCKR